VAALIPGRWSSVQVGSANLSVMLFTTVLVVFCNIIINLLVARLGVPREHCGNFLASPRTGSSVSYCSCQPTWRLRPWPPARAVTVCGPRPCRRADSDWQSSVALVLRVQLRLPTLTAAGWSARGRRPLLIRSLEVNLSAGPAPR
jgi:hypothetical protein